MARRRHGKCAELRVVLILKAKSDSVLGILGRGSLSCVRRTSGVRSMAIDVAYQVAYSPADWKVLRKIPDMMTGPTSEPFTSLNRASGSNDNHDHSPSLQDQILNHISSLETLIKEHNTKFGAPITPIRLTFGDEEGGDKGKDKGKGPVEEVDEDLKKPYKEVLKSPFTR
ncbi:hypothetical protein Tco_1381206 [Tanacetum coccineum]